VRGEENWMDIVGFFFVEIRVLFILLVSPEWSRVCAFAACFRWNFILLNWFLRRFP